MTCSIAGYGAVSAAGTSRAASAQTYASGSPCSRRDPATGLPVFPVTNLKHSPDAAIFSGARPTDRAGKLALAAAEMAVETAGWRGKEFSILVGCSRGPTESWEQTYDEFLREGRPPVRTSPLTTLGSLAFLLADYFGTTELATGMSVTCSSGSHAILQGVALLQSGMTDRVLVGGTEAPLTTFTLRQMQALRVYAEPADDERYPTRPLTGDPTGMALGEGAAFLALERRANHHPFALDGVGFSRERHQSSTGISAAGTALQTAMLAATTQSDRQPDAIFAHAPGTRKGDAAERAAIEAVFGREASIITSMKWATGHTFGASGPLAVVAALQMMEAKAIWLPPYLPTPEVAKPPENALINATGFGGNAVSISVTLSAAT
ncbi:3-oxoacyl-(acyl-carrier-protein) synthase [Neolewinella xylanilytica]|uniref:3-oxoacyl-(Acyl-carrier-protein) synthase n=1 Tax=Neolewinella xylanilytica TaxID=1514080 RepID=A0A2S6I682_9BACT|nr:beta-ketoacyl synthase N-terminal-like domain-containing protein [Neolewinella xylanilytica]PPK86621.1 3-oxoacyl-(acyl-carrier-protein) synthase [Neolewinella xylanilytica]